MPVATCPTCGERAQRHHWLEDDWTSGVLACPFCETCIRDAGLHWKPYLPYLDGELAPPPPKA